MIYIEDRKFKIINILVKSRLNTEETDNMALRDEIKAGRKDLMENGTLKDKIAYFFDYYTLHTIAIVAVLIFVASFIYKQVTKPDIVLKGLVINAPSSDGENPVEDLKNGFIEYINLDTEQYEMSLNSSLIIDTKSDPQQAQLKNYEVTQAIMAQCVAGSVDFMSAPLEAILDYAYGELCVNLNEVLSEEELEKYEPYFLYVDLAVVDQKNKAIDNNQYSYEIPCPDPTKPEEMKEPIPVLIDVTTCEKMANIYNSASDTLAVAVAVNAPNPDRISDFLAYLFEE